MMSLTSTSKKLTRSRARDVGRSSGFFSKHRTTKSLNSCQKNARNETGMGKCVLTVSVQNARRRTPHGEREERSTSHRERGERGAHEQEQGPTLHSTPQHSGGKRYIRGTLQHTGDQSHIPPYSIEGTNRAQHSTGWRVIPIIEGHPKHSGPSQA